MDASTPVSQLAGPVVPVVGIDGSKVAERQLNPGLFDVPLSIHILHSVVLWQLAKRRSGSHETKQRGEVSGSNRKPYKQKRTGRARSGSKRAPHCRGGGVAFGPHVRDYEFDLNKKVRKLGLRVAISDRVRSGALQIVRNVQELTKTKDMLSLVNAVGGETSKVLVVSNEHVRPALNLGRANSIPVVGLNVYDILKHDHVLIDETAVEAVEARLV